MCCPWRGLLVSAGPWPARPAATTTDRSPFPCQHAITPGVCSQASLAFLPGGCRVRG